MKYESKTAKLLSAVAVLAMVVCAFAIVAPESDAASKTVIVSTDGDDTSGDGSTQSPYATIGKAIENVTSGDIIEIATDYTIDASISIPAGITLSVPAGKTLTVSTGQVLTILGTLDVTGTLALAERTNIAGAENTGATNIVLHGGCSVTLKSTSLISTTDLATGAEVVVSKLNGTPDEGGNYGYTATLTKGVFTLSGASDAFGIGPNTVLNIADGAELVIACAVTNTGTINNEGKVSFKSGATAKSLDTSNGTFNNEGGEVVLDNGTVTGYIEGGNVTAKDITGMTAFPQMDQFTYNKRIYLTYTYVYAGADGDVVYQYGLAVNDIEYDGDPIMDDELSVIPIALPLTEETKLAFSNTDSSWYDKVNGEYSGALKADGAPGAKLYEGVIRFTATISDSNANSPLFVGNTLIKYLDLEVLKGQYTGTIKITGWNLGDYDSEENGPTVTVVNKDKEPVSPSEYTVSYEYFTDEACTRSAGTDPSKLGVGTYWVKATFTNDPNYEITATPVTFDVVRASEVEFHPLQDLNDTAKESQILGGVDPDDFQHIKFKDLGDYKVRVTGMVEKITDDTAVETDSWSLLNKLFTGEIGTSASKGYFIAFYVAGVDDMDLTAVTVLVEEAVFPEYNADGTEKTMTDNKLANIPVDDDTGYLYYIMYIADLQADVPVEDPATGVDGFTYAIDFDGNDSVVYSKTTYTVDVSYLNYYEIVLHDVDEKEYNNDTLYYYRVDGAKFTLPSGAYDGFTHWTLEKGGDYSYRPFQFGSVMIVGEKYDANLDYTIDLYAEYGSTTPVDPTPSEPAKKVALGIYNDGSKVYFMLMATDGGAIPAGTVTVTYQYMVWDDFFGAYIPGTPGSMTLDVTGGSSHELLEADGTQFTEFSNIIQITAIYAATDGSITVENFQTYTVTLVPPSETE